MTAGPVRVRPAAVAGRFYPDDPHTLAAMVDDALVHAAAPAADAVPKALVVPHAGYRFSGPIAATGYRTLAPARETIRRVVLLGPAHHVGVRGIAVSGADAFLTPLGPVPVDAEARTAVLALPGVVVDDRAHGPEHSLEVHLPFLQRVLTRFTVLPLVVGGAEARRERPGAAQRQERRERPGAAPAWGRSSPGREANTATQRQARTVADVLDAVWGGPETLIVVSSDLSHYLDHEAAGRRDRATADAIVRGDGGAVSGHDACGAAPIRGLLLAAAEHGLHGELLDLRTSGDTAGDRARVVGYGAFVFGRSSTP